jgi:DNA-binding CsgD family transcriptional regulator
MAGRAARRARGRRLDSIGVIEACYRTETDERAWLSGILDELRPLDEGRGLLAYRFDASDPENLLVEAAVDRSELVGWEQVIVEAHRITSPDLVRALYSGSRHQFIHSELDALRASGRDREVIDAVHRRLGVRASLGLIGAEPTRRGVAVVVPSTGSRPLAPRTRHQLGAIVSHLCSAVRLRDAAGSSAPTPEDELTEAVLDPSGHVEHAVSIAGGEMARASLSAAVRRIEQARGKARRVDSEGALALWRGLVDGIWSLVDHVEADGKRLILARRNAPGKRDPKALSARERQVITHVVRGDSNKHIGHALGIGASAVAGHIDSALRKLGIASRRGLISAFSSGSELAPASPQAGSSSGGSDDPGP